MSKLMANASILGGRNDLSFAQNRVGAVPGRAVVVRRRLAYPRTARDGLVLVDTEELFPNGLDSAQGYKRWVFALDNSNTEGGLRQLELTHYQRVLPGTGQTARLRFWHSTHEVERQVLDLGNIESIGTNGLRLVRTSGAVYGELSWTWTPVGRVTWSPASSAPIVLQFHTLLIQEGRLSDLSDRVVRRFSLTVEQSRLIPVPLSIPPGRVPPMPPRRIPPVPPRRVPPMPPRRTPRVPPRRVSPVPTSQTSPSVEVLIAEFTETFSPDSGIYERHVSIADRMPAVIGQQEVELEAGAPYYYQFFEADERGALVGEEDYRAACLATRRHGFARNKPLPGSEAALPEYRLYELLPSIVRQLDERRPSDRGNGQLRNFLEAFGCAFDALLSQADALPLRHNTREVRADLLRCLAAYIGWDLDHTEDAIQQRLDVQFAPEVFRSVGSAPNLKALATRTAGVNVRLKEYVNNVAFTHLANPSASRQPELQSVEPLVRWELWRGWEEQGVWSEDRLTETSAFHGRPALVVDAQGKRWIFWHALENGRWSLFAAREGAASRGERITDQDPDVSRRSEVDPAVIRVPASSERYFLFSSVYDDQGAMNLRVRTLTLGDAGLVLLPVSPGSSETAVELTDHPAEDRRPFAVQVGRQIWLFWQSSRSGTSAVWTRRLAGSDPRDWTTPAERVTDGRYGDVHPSCARDGASVHLVWSRNHGSYSRLWERVFSFSSAEWSESVPITDEGSLDVAPAVLRVGSSFRLVWESDRQDPASPRSKHYSRLWVMENDGGGWNVGASRPRLLVDSYSGDAEPAQALEGFNKVHTAWRSQKGGKVHWTRTFDTADESLINRIGSFEDGAFYTYDTRRNRESEAIPRPAGDIVGVFLDTTTQTHNTIRQRMARARDFIDPFRPVHLRYAWVQPEVRFASEAAGAGLDDGHYVDLMVWIHTWSSAHPHGRTINTDLSPFDTKRRIVDSQIVRMAMA